MKIINRSGLIIDKEAMMLIARQNGSLSPTINIFSRDIEKHGRSSGEYLPYGLNKYGRKVSNKHGEIRLYLETTDPANLILWYFAHEYRHCMQELLPQLSDSVYNTNREKLIAELCEGGEFTSELYWKWHEILPEEIDANCFASLISGYCRLGANVTGIPNPSFPEYAF